MLHTTRTKARFIILPTTSCKCGDDTSSAEGGGTHITPLSSARGGHIYHTPPCGGAAPGCLYPCSHLQWYLFFVSPLMYFHGPLALYSTPFRVLLLESQSLSVGGSFSTPIIVAYFVRNNNMITVYYYNDNN